jgi:hypothetical protein
MPLCFAWSPNLRDENLYQARYEIAGDEITGTVQDQLALRTRTALEGTGR